MNPDILDRLAAYAPTDTSLADEWGPRERVGRLAAVLDDRADQRRLRFRPRVGALRTRAIAPIAASVVVLAVAGTLATVGAGNADGPPALGPGPGAATGPSTTPVFHATVATPHLQAHQWAYRALTSYDVSPSTNSTPVAYATWVARDGSGRRLNTEPGINCGQIGATRHPGFEAPTQAFVDALPSEATELEVYLIKRAQGSTSREEAIFTAVSDLLRTGDLLASSDQRAAMVTVLAGLKRTSVHDDVDERGRKAVRVDFVDPNQRGSEIQSLYFDPDTFQLLEERSSEASFTPNAGPSAPYTSTPSEQASSAQQLPAKASVTVMTAERVVDALPANCGQK